MPHSPRPKWTPADIAANGVVHVANAFGQMFAEQGHLGAMPATTVSFVVSEAQG
jgi:hypothetical protein